MAEGGQTQPAPKTLGEGEATAKLLEAVLAGAVAVGILVALADTSLYPIAFGIVTIAGLYVVMDGGALSSLSDLSKWLSAKM